MSMLAEPKRRVKWSLNPRGNLWAKDDSKFGQKLLEKMGWQKGKGLGKLENGQVEHIKVVYKNDNNGVGWDEQAHGWISHQKEFDTILANLNNNFSKKSKDSSFENDVDKTVAAEPVSLEQRAKSFRSRLHYRKFLHAKDVSQYSQKDLESIFGKKVCTEENLSAEVKKQADAEHDKEDGVGDYSNYSGVTTFKSSSSLTEYFSQKMKNKFGSKGATDSSSEQPSGNFSDSGCKSMTTDDESITQVETEGIVKKKKENKKNKQRDKGTEDTSLSCDVPIADVDVSKKKLKRQNEDSPVFTESIDTDCYSMIPKKRKKSKHTTQNLTVVDAFSNNDQNLSRPLPVAVLKSCLKIKSTSNLLQKKCVTFSECISSCHEIPSDTKEKGNDSDANEESNPTLSCEAENPGTLSCETENPDILSCEAENLDTLPCEAENPDTLSCEAENPDTLSCNATLCFNNASSSTTFAETEANSLHAHRSFGVGQFLKTKSIPSKNNESWNASIKIAEKMAHYASIIKNIQLHDILSTTNLLDIKGYGN